jgi:hypothetical protein
MGTFHPFGFEGMTLQHPVEKGLVRVLLWRFPVRGSARSRQFRFYATLYHRKAVNVKNLLNKSGFLI